MRISDSTKVKLEEKYKLVDSDEFNNVMYAVDRKGKGLHIVYQGREVIPLAAENVLPFIEELKAVWETIGVKASITHYPKG